MQDLAEEGRSARRVGVSECIHITASWNRLESARKTVLHETIVLI